MKIISGNFKGRSILINKKDNFRPTLSRIREDLFNIIAHNKDISINLENVTFCDLFCGSGSIGLEALSRGAKKVIFNDINKRNLKIIKRFLDEIKFKKYSLYNEDAYSKSKEVLNNSNIVYVDPPYSDNINFFSQSIYKSAPEDCLIIFETEQNFEHSDLILVKRYKNKNLFFLKKTNET